MRHIIFAACLLLAGCKIESNPNAPPTPQAEDSALPQRGGFCAFPCVGPHLRLGGGGISFFSFGPGIEF